MFCPTCGFEYTQKTNYCKRCGAILTSSDKPPVVQLPALRITGAFFVIAAFVLFSLMFVFEFYKDMVRNQILGPDALIPFAFGIVLIGAVAGLLCWQLSRVIGITRKQEDWAAKQQRPSFTEVHPQGHLAAPADPARNAAEPPSVIEHTTRQMASVYREPAARE